MNTAFERKLRVHTIVYAQNSEPWSPKTRKKFKYEALVCYLTTNYETCNWQTNVGMLAQSVVCSQSNFHLSKLDVQITSDGGDVQTAAEINIFFGYEELLVFRELVC